MLPSILTRRDITMNTLEISEVTGSRHDNVMKSVERLVGRGVIKLPAMQEVTIKRTTREVLTKVYIFSGEQGKRDSLIVVAQLSPEFTGTLVDRWIELETHLEIGGRAQVDLLKYASEIGLLDHEDITYLVRKVAGLDAPTPTKVQEYASVPVLAKMLDLEVTHVRDLLHVAGVYDEDAVVIRNGRRINILSSFGQTLAVKKTERSNIKWKIPQTVDFLKGSK